jgi:hypothetical protein
MEWRCGRPPRSAIDEVTHGGGHPRSRATRPRGSGGTGGGPPSAGSQSAAIRAPFWRARRAPGTASRASPQPSRCRQAGRDGTKGGQGGGLDVPDPPRSRRPASGAPRAPGPGLGVPWPPPLRHPAGGAAQAPGSRTPAPYRPRRSGTPRPGRRASRPATSSAPTSPGAVPATRPGRRRGSPSGGGVDPEPGRSTIHRGRRRGHAGAPGIRVARRRPF